jgi:hypothetical protein
MLNVHVPGDGITSCSILSMVRDINHGINGIDDWSIRVLWLIQGYWWAWFCVPIGSGIGTKFSNRISVCMVNMQCASLRCQPQTLLIVWQNNGISFPKSFSFNGSAVRKLSRPKEFWDGGVGYSSKSKWHIDETCYGWPRNHRTDRERVKEELDECMKCGFLMTTDFSEDACTWQMGRFSSCFFDGDWIWHMMTKPCAALLRSFQWHLWICSETFAHMSWGICKLGEL